MEAAARSAIELHAGCALTDAQWAAARARLLEFVGIGNRRRIRFLRWRTRSFTLNAGSHTTKRLKGEADINIAHPLVREHRAVWSK